MYRTMIDNYRFPCGTIAFRKGNVVKLLSSKPDEDGDIRVKGSLSNDPFYCNYQEIIELSTNDVTEEGIRAYESH